MNVPHINKVGVELEGAWGKRLFEDAEIHEDISVPAPQLTVGHYGEIASDPLLPEDVPAWIRKHFPVEIPAPVDGKSCGLHVHLSFSTVGDYCRVMSAGFYKLFLQEIDQWAYANVKDPVDLSLFLQRHQGRNRFARRLYLPSRQVGVLKKDSSIHAERRTLLNYCHGLHETVEVRLFPMFKDPEVAVGAVMETIRIFSRFLSSQEGVQESPISHVLRVGEVLSR